MKKQAAWALLPILSLAAIVVGCGGDPEPAMSATGATDGASSGGSDAASASSGNSAGAGGAASAASSSSTGGGAAAPGVRQAAVSVFSGARDASIPRSFQAEAWFKSSPDGMFGEGTSTAVGPCVVKVTAIPIAPGALVDVSAGAITIEGGAEVVTLAPDATNAYPTVRDDAHDLFQGGETITVTAASGAVPAFTVAAIAPDAIDLTSPAQPAGDGPLPVDRTRDLVFTWDHGGAGSIIVLLGDGTSTSLTCTFSSAAGRGTIPAAALGMLAPNAVGFFSLEPASLQTVTAGDWPIDVVVGSSMTWNRVPNPQTFTYQASN